MQDALRVGERHRIGDLREEPQALGERDRAGEMPIQAIALYPLHRVERAAVGKRADLVHRDDPGMLEPGKHLRLAPQARLEAGIGKVENLEGHAPAQLGVLDHVDGPHAARARDSDELILRAGEIGLPDRGAQAGHGPFGEVRHSAFSPRSARASSRNSASSAVSSRSTSSTIRRRSPRTRKSRLVTSVTAMPKR